MAESNIQALDINMVDALDEQRGLLDPTVEEKFQSSPWYSNILYVLTHLNAPPELSKTKARFLKLNSKSYCIMNEILYWKNAMAYCLNVCQNLKQKGLNKNSMQESVEAT